jgi:hypothetical protein
VRAGLRIGERQVGGEVLVEDLLRAVLVGALDLDLHVETARAQDRGVDEVLAVRRADHDHVLQALDAVDLREELRHDRALDVGRDAGAAGAEEGVHLVEEHDDRVALLRLLAGALEDQADLPFGLADVLVEQLGALDVEEVRAVRLAPRLLGHALGERVGHRLGDERLATPRRPVEEDALGRLQLVLVEQLRVEVGQLDRVLDLVDLLVEPADVVVGDVGNLLEHELLDLGARDALHQEAGAAVHQEVVAGAQLLTEERGAELAHPFLVGPAHDERAGAVLEELFEHDDLAGDLRLPRQDHVVRLVERDFLAATQLLDVDFGMDRDAHLAPRGEHVDRTIVIRGEKRAVGRRRHGELLDLFPERGNVLARFTEGRGEAFVLGDGLGQLTLRLQDLLLQRAHPLRCVLEPPTEDDDLFLEALQLALELADLALVLGKPSILLGRHVTTSLDPPAYVRGTLHRGGGRDGAHWRCRDTRSARRRGGSVGTTRSRAPGVFPVDA